MNLLDTTWETAEMAFPRKLIKKVNMTVAALGRMVTPDGYTGPRLFNGGMVVEFEGDHFNYPEDADESVTSLPLDLFANAAGVDFPSVNDNEKENKSETADVFIAEQIMGNVYYVDGTEESQ